LLLDSFVKEPGGCMGRSHGVRQRAGSRNVVCPPIDYRFWRGGNELWAAGLGWLGAVSGFGSVCCWEEKDLGVV
jgi:hypothetical protein